MPDGDGCVCGAQSYSECGCPDADWTCGACAEKQAEIDRLRSTLSRQEQASIDGELALQALHDACYWAFTNGYGLGHHQTVEGTFEDESKEEWWDIWSQDKQCFVDETVTCWPLWLALERYINPEAPNPTANRPAVGGTD